MWEVDGEKARVVYRLLFDALTEDRQRQVINSYAWYLIYTYHYSLQVSDCTRLHLLTVAVISFLKFLHFLLGIYRWGRSGVVVSMLDFRSEGRWFDAQSLPPCRFLRQETLPHIVSLHPGV